MLSTGFKISEGKFIKLVGGDDEIDLNFIKNLITQMKIFLLCMMQT